GPRDGVRGHGPGALPLRGAGMTTGVLAHVVVSGLATGSIYALMALALVIIYNATRTLNFAQGEMLMVSAFVAWASYTRLGLPLVVALAVAVAASALLAFVVERVIIRRSIAATHWDVLIITLGLSLVLRAGAGLVWSHDDFVFPSFFGNDPIVLGRVRLAPVSLGIIAASLAIMLGLYLLFTFTRLGRAMRAVAQNQNAARLMGISVERVYSASWVLAAVVGALAGVLIAPVVFVSTKMGLVVINGFTAAVLGGFGSMPGAILGGMLLGVIENLAPLYLPTGIRYAVPFLLLIGILVVRPSGLLGRVERRKV
ncbi:MAG: branched-chain amino acid ABC transporter permease, partial [Candidatus Rokuibacteriota bacterium]